ncbi:MAG: GAF domain-containing sensor histidine kinase [Chloroflexi bacterium]|nr:GAF domain-containing sensor histidine kinase [Chloroflexota bacterium]
MAQLIGALDAKPVARVEHSLFRVRWVLWLLVIPIAWIDVGGEQLPESILVWLLVVAIVNVAIRVILQFNQDPSPRFFLLTFAFDVVFFGLLPHLSNTDTNLLAFFAIYPALVAAVRFGPQQGLIVAGLLALPIEIRAFLPIFSQRSLSALSSGLPVAALLAATALVGYLARHEKDAAIKQAAAELDELRHAMAGAKLLYQTTDALSSTTSYAPVLEAMLEAGVKGLPPGRREDGLPVGVALFFDEKDAEKQLRVVASRHLDRRDTEQHIAGKAGIIGEALQSGNFVVFDNVATDPELSAFGALGRCRSGVCYPLQAGLEQYGVVVLAGPAPRRPSEQHLELMRAFTNQAAIAFQNAKLYENLRVEHDQTIRSESEMRQKMARDLHDGPTQHVAALVMQLDYIQRLLDKNPAEARAELGKAREVAQQTVKEIRTMLFTLRPLALETKGLSAALEQFCERLRDSEKVPIQVAPGDFGNELDLNVAAPVFAIIDEAVNNARKHAAGMPIYVQVGRQGGMLVAVVQDQGPGFDVDKVVSSYDQRSSLGLQNMRERARLIEADLRIESAPRQGTRITLIVPLPPAQPAKPHS